MQSRDEGSPRGVSPPVEQRRDRYEKLARQFACRRRQPPGHRARRAYVTNEASGIQKVEIAFQDLSEFQRIAFENNRSDPGRWLEVKRIIGMCLLIKREVVNRIGYFDEAFSPGHYEDDDYCHRARLAGYRLLICGDVLVHHRGSVSFRQAQPEQLQALIERNYRLFIEKWHFDPRQFIEEH